MWSGIGQNIELGNVTDPKEGAVSRRVCAWSKVAGYDESNTTFLRAFN